MELRLSRQMEMTVDQINRRIDTLRLNPSRILTQMFVCDATVEQWNVLVDSEALQLRSSYMEWIDSEIYIVELPSLEHEYYSVCDGMSRQLVLCL
ncbi:unnamed protein product [Phytophthora lilii]|uniref:Unnamed protein product n=1 Tax=Phytophthora lilii TaxID=2077276 RepID=A0A9W6THZ0_9STRA|nr:unnamed protein product [Phytophthora lilii]